MKKIKINSVRTLLICLIILVGCNPHKDSRLYFSNNIESSYAWNENHQSNIIKNDEAHSGSYVSKIDASNPYSVTFHMRLSDISSKPLKSVHISVWIKLSTLASNPQLVADIRENNQNSLEWIAKSAKEDIATPNKWQQVTMNLNLEEKNRNNADHYLRIYISNGEKDYALVDDIEIQFTEK